MLERGPHDPERVGGFRYQLLIGLQRGHHHPVEREEEHEQEYAERHVQGHPSPWQGLQVFHAEALLLVAHLSPPPCCQARRCSPKYENRIAASRKGIIRVASAAPSPRAPPGMPRWNDSVAMRCVELRGPPRVRT